MIVYVVGQKFPGDRKPALNIGSLCGKQKKPAGTGFLLRIKNAVAFSHTCHSEHFAETGEATQVVLLKKGFF